MNYTRAYLKARINAMIKNKIGILVDVDSTCNQAVREAFGEINFRSAKRKLHLPAGLMNDLFSYPAPIDLSGTSIMDILPLDPSQRTNSELVLTIPTEFWRKRSSFTCAVDDSDSFKKILISIPVDSTGQTVATLDSMTGNGGIWEAFDADTENVALNTADYIKGKGSIGFDINAIAGTTAGIKNDNLDAFDFTNYLQGTGYVYVNIADPAGITNFKLRLGDDSSNYYEFTATTTNENTSFIQGVNLLRFSVRDFAQVGTPSITTSHYAAVYMTKETTKVSETDYWFDQIILRTSSPYQMTYYSQYGWLDIDGVYKLESTDDSDILVSNADEFDVVLAKAVGIAAYEVAEYQIAKDSDAKYAAKRDLYCKMNPDESLPIIMSYYDFI